MEEVGEEGRGRRGRGGGERGGMLGGFEGCCLAVLLGFKWCTGWKRVAFSLVCCGAARCWRIQRGGGDFKGEDRDVCVLTEDGGNGR